MHTLSLSLSLSLSLTLSLSLSHTLSLSHWLSLSVDMLVTGTRQHRHNWQQSRPRVHVVI